MRLHLPPARRVGWVAVYVVAARLGGELALPGQFEVEPLGVPAHCPVWTIRQRKSLSQLACGLMAQHGQVGRQ